LADAIDANADTVRRLLRALIGRGVFRQLRDGRYALNPLADTLRSDADVSLRGMARYVGAPQHREHWSRLTTAIRTRRAVVAEMRGEPIFEYLSQEKELDDRFKQHRVADRVQLAEGSFFDTVTEGGDAYVLKHIVHDWPDEEAEQILRNVRKAAGVGKHVLACRIRPSPPRSRFCGQLAGPGNPRRIRRPRARRRGICPTAGPRRIPHDAGGENGIAVQRGRGGCRLSPDSPPITGIPGRNPWSFLPWQQLAVPRVDMAALWRHAQTSSTQIAIARSNHMSAVSGIQARHLHDATDSLLRFAMRADATLTGLCGLAVALVADPLSSLTGWNSNLEYALGAFFVLYGLVVFSLAAWPNLRNAGLGVVVANIVFTLGAVVAVDTVPMTASGVAATLASGVYTAAFAGLQYLGVRRLQPA
jgi:hypothetical protein